MKYIKGKMLINGNKKDTVVQNKGEQLVNQIERHDSDLNNDIVMARPDLLVHIFDLNNQSLVINEARWLIRNLTKYIPVKMMWNVK